MSQLRDYFKIRALQENPLEKQWVDCSKNSCDIPDIAQLDPK